MTIQSLFDSVSLSDIVTVSDPALLSQPCTAPRRDSRLVGAGDVFFCIRGRSHDGHTDLADAAARGAVCAVLDNPVAIPLSEEAGLPWMLVTDTAACFLPACLSYHGHPEVGMHLYAVTGTNGKTSVTYLLEAILSACAEYAPCAVFGTVENRIAGAAYPTENTTPAPEVTAELLAKARDVGVRTVILEASSHALAQNRLSGLTFDIGIFTNLSEDHLDYHPTAEDYFLAKRRLFLVCRRALINTDDPFGARLYCDDALPAKRYSFSPCGASADYPMSFLPHDLTEVPCDFIAANRLAAAACADLAGVTRDKIGDAIRSMPPIPGRMEILRREPFSVIVDYAHTPDALERALTGLRRTASGQLHVIFGCGGDREHQKRPKMGALAAALADRVILTADNSRSECVFDILADIVSGIPEQRRGRVTVIPDRRAAILYTLKTAGHADTVLLAGKGHETHQTDRSGIHPFSERDIIQAYFKKHP